MDVYEGASDASMTCVRREHAGAPSNGLAGCWGQVVLSGVVNVDV